jgi:GNAT acetyltransferase
MAQPFDVVIVTSLKLLEKNFQGWIASEIAERSPIYAVMDGAFPVSICFCARNAETAAEAGVETASAFRGRGFAPHATAAWARAIRATGRTPLYSTSWSNPASLAVARKLRLMHYASHWSLSRNP